MPPKTRAVRRVDSESDLSLDGIIDVDKMSVDGKLIVEAITKQISTLREAFLQKLSVKDNEIMELNRKVSKLESQVEKLEQVMDDAGASERRDCIVFVGDGVPPSETGENCKNLICNLSRDKLGLNIDSADVSSAHRIGRKSARQGPDRRAIVARLCRSDLKNEIRSAAKNMRPNFYVNEYLTPVRSSIFRALKAAKKKFPRIISGFSTIDGSVYAWLKTENAGAGNTRDTRFLINSHKKLLEFCREKLNCELLSIIDVWPH